MIAQLVAIYQGNKIAQFNDKNNERSFSYQQIKVSSANEDDESFDDMILSVPLDMDFSVCKKNHTYIFNIQLPTVQRENARLRCVGVVPFES